MGLRIQFPVLIARKSERESDALPGRLESLTRTREQKLGATLSDKIKIVLFSPAK
jgi:hypothetical protein